MAAARGQTKQTGRKKVESINWPTNDKGEPLAQISFTASELVPTGNYANVTVGPVTVTSFIDPAVPISDKEIKNLTDRCNQFAEAVENSVSEQRELVLENLQASVEEKRSKAKK